MRAAIRKWYLARMNPGCTKSLLLTLLALVLLPAPAANQPDGDWPQWRGPNRDGLSRETGLLREWPAEGPPLAWKAGGAGTGYSSFSVADGRVFTMGARGGTEYVFAYDAATGKRLWERALGGRFRNDRGDGPRGTPTVAGNRLYALSANGDLACLDVRSGQAHWSFNILQRFGGRNPNWGLSESPLVAGDRVLVNAGGPGASIVAVRTRDGSTIWQSGSDPAAYSSAILHRAAGAEQAIYFTARRALGVDVRDGRLLWGYERVSNRTANIATPIAHGDRVFVSSDYGTGAALLQLQPAGGGMTSREVYFTRDMRNHHSSSVLVGDHLYGFSSAILTAMRFSDGTVAWRDRSVGKGSLVFADERLYLYSENGVVGLAEATPEGYREHGRFTIQAGSLPTWSHPVVSNGHLYLRDQDTIYAYRVRTGGAAAR
jgi:outer membrane protein assembly factor BamB